MQDIQLNTKTSTLYGLIIAVANFAGSVMPSFFPIINTLGDTIADFFSVWGNFWNVFILFISFAIPTILCFSYCTKKEDYLSRFVNLPFAYAIRGITGWILAYFSQIVVLILAISKGYQVSFFSSFLAITIDFGTKTITIFTISYFLLDFFHRNFVLPRIFPNGHIISSKKQPSVRFLFTINYISVTIFPLLFLSSILLSHSLQGTLQLSANTILLFVAILAIGIVISFILSFYFEKPLLLLKKRIEKLEEGDYKSKVKIISNDAFGELADSFNDMTATLFKKNQKIQEIQNSVVTGMAIMVESRDNSTGGHIKRTSRCIEIFANALKTHPDFCHLSNDFFDSLIKAAPMHDLGKIAVDDAILRKPGKFTEEEYEIMKTHAKEGARIVENVLEAVDDVAFKQIAINVAHYHHEKYDGTGYPEKLKGEEIPLEARIMALADVFDALVSKRCYKEEFSFDKAFNIIEESLGTHFDAQLGKIFIQCRTKLMAMYLANG